MNYDPDTVIGQTESRRAQIEAQKENTARRAKAYATWTTKGIGEILVPKAFYFGVTFIEEPTFVSGMALAEGSELVAGHFPRAACGVYEWVKQPAPKGTKELFVGAFVFFVVDTVGPGQVLGSEPQYEIHHHLVWEGLAMKDLPAHLLDF
jgi:hypothetical protein